MIAAETFGAALARAGEASIDAGHDHLALELAEHGQHPEHRPPRRRRRVERLRVNIESDAGVADGLQDIDEMLQGTAQAVGGPDGQHVEVAAYG